MSHERRACMKIGRFPTLNLFYLGCKVILTFITFHAPCVLEVTVLNEQVALRIEFYCLCLEVGLFLVDLQMLRSKNVYFHFDINCHIYIFSK